MTYFVFIPIIFLFFYLISCSGKPKEIIDWKSLYNDKKTNDAIKYDIKNAINNCSVKEEEDISANFFGATGIDNPVVEDVTYQNFNVKEVFEKLLGKYELETLSKFFTESELKKENKRYKIDLYKEKIQEIRHAIENKTSYFDLIYLKNS